MGQFSISVGSCTIKPLQHQQRIYCLLQAAVKTEDLMARRVETWLRDLEGATHVLDVYRNKLVDKRVLLGLDKFTRLRAMDPLAAYDDILI